MYVALLCCKRFLLLASLDSNCSAGREVSNVVQQIDAVHDVLHSFAQIFTSAVPGYVFYSVFSRNSLAGEQLKCTFFAG